MSEQEEMTLIMYPGIGDEALEQLATDIIERKVFLNTQIPVEDFHFISICFMRILMQPARERKLFQMYPPAIVYEYISEAIYQPVPKQDSGLGDIFTKYPMFNTMRCLNWSDLTTLQEKLIKQKKEQLQHAR